MTRPPPSDGLASPRTPSQDTPPSETSARFDALRAITTPLAGDILYGAGEVALYLFGDRSLRRRLYRKIARNELPVFRIGANICARKTVLAAWMAAQEQSGKVDI